MIIGYARVSTTDQNLDRQMEALNKAGCERIFEDKLSGSTIERPGLDALLQFIREGDKLIVSSIDRLGRSTIDLLNIVQHIRDKRADIEFLKEKIDLATSVGKLILTVFSAIAEMERETIRERQAQGIEIAKQKGLYKGRQKIPKPKIWDKLAAEFIAGTISGYEMRKRLGVSSGTYYRMRHEYGPEITGSIRVLDMPKKK